MAYLLQKGGSVDEAQDRILLLCLLRGGSGSVRVDGLPHDKTKEIPRKCLVHSNNNPLKVQSCTRSRFVHIAGLACR